MSYFPEILPDDQQSALRSLAAPTRELGYYLGGGTAVALRLGHRLSVDLDWFTHGRMGDPQVLAQRIREAGVPFEQGWVDVGTLYGTVGGVSASFLEYDYELLRPAEVAPEHGIEIASIEDLTAMKLAALVGRGARKDFVDLYAIGRAGISCRDALDLYREKFRTREIGHVLMSLGYFADAERNPMPDMLWAVTWAEMKASLVEWRSPALRD